MATAMEAPMDTNERITSMREKGPGAARYGLPSTIGYVKHDFTKHKYPAYTFGHKGKSIMLDGDECSPGPKYLVDPRISRVGTEGAPKYTMRPKALYDPTFVTPGPGTYNNERVKPMKEPRAPVYTMRMRTRYQKQDAFPGANSYTLPSGLGPKQPSKRSRPAWSMPGRKTRGHFAEDMSKTPGPAKTVPAMNIYKNKPPLYSLQGRNYMPGDTTQKPGPGAHNPEQVTVNKPKAPKFPMGKRHSEFVCVLLTQKDV